MRALTESTLVPIGLAVVAIGGGAAWLTSMHSATARNLETTQRLEVKQDAYNADIQKIYQELAEIKGELKRLTN